MTASRRFRPALIVGVAALAAAVLWWTFGRTPPRAESKPVMASAPAPTPAAASAPVVAAPMTPVAGPVAGPQELVATARMYAAHAPLRIPEVADPDSATNKQILQTMVSKALAQAASGSSVTKP